MKHLLAGAACTFVVALAATGAHAQDFTAINACMDTIRTSVAANFRGAEGIGSYNPKSRTISRSETGVSGVGQFDRGGRTTEFFYDCIFNQRTGETYGVNVRLRGGGQAGNQQPRPPRASRQPPPSRQPSGDEIGAALGLAIVGAIVGGIVSSQQNQHQQQQPATRTYADPPDDGGGALSGGQWSPEPGVTCQPVMSACYNNDGSFSPLWTNRIYGAGGYAD